MNETETLHIIYQLQQYLGDRESPITESIENALCMLEEQLRGSNFND